MSRKRAIFSNIFHMDSWETNISTPACQDQYTSLWKYKNQICLVSQKMLLYMQQLHMWWLLQIILMHLRWLGWYNVTYKPLMLLKYWSIYFKIPGNFCNDEHYLSKSWYQNCATNTLKNNTDLPPHHKESKRKGEGLSIPRYI